MWILIESGKVIIRFFNFSNVSIFVYDACAWYNNFIILNNSIRPSVRTPPQIMQIKNKIKEIFNIIVHFTYESQKGTHIHIEREILFRIKYKIIELIKVFNQYKLKSPIQCLEQTKCTDIIFLDSLEQHIKNFEKAKKFIYIKND